MSAIHELPTAVVYHEETKYSEEELRRNPRQPDWTKQPSPYKDVVSERKVDLVPWLPFKRSPFTGEEIPDPPTVFGSAPTLAEVSRLLFFTYGVTAVMETPAGRQPLRAAPSAGALYPTEIYVATQGVEGLADGVHDYQVRDHSLVALWDGDFRAELARYAFDHPALAKSRMIIVLSSVFRRSAWRYEERAYRRVLLDAGHALGNLEAIAARERLRVRPVGGFCDDAVNSVLFLDPEEEGVVALCAIGTDEDFAGPVVRRGGVAPSRVVPTPARTPREGLLRRLHSASGIAPDAVFADEDLSDAAALERTYADRPRTPLPGAAFELPVELTIARRRSARAFTGGSLEARQVADALTYAYDRTRPSLDAAAPTAFDPSLLETYVVVHGVEGVDPGIYYYAPAASELRLLKKGRYRDQLRHFCLGQTLGADAAVVVVHVANLLEALGKYGERAYRYLHLDAGVIGQRMNLAAVALGFGATGIGGFFDDEFNALAGLGPERIVVYATCLGAVETAT